jgi:hypothetical protein
MAISSHCAVSAEKYIFSEHGGFMTQLVAGKPAIRSMSQWVSLSLLIFSLTGVLSGCEEPFIVMSGDVLQGTVSDPPADWTALNKVRVVQLETRPESPYSVNIWMVGLGPDLYLATGDDATAWSEHIDDNSNVRVRISAALYELEARRVTDNREQHTVAAAYASKYELDVDDNWVLDGQVFRLDRR